MLSANQHGMRGTPPSFKIALILSIALAIGIVRCFFARADEIVAPGQGALGTNANALGARIPWSKVAVPKKSGAVAADAGANLYANWCASCHGEKGQGDGVLSKALNPPPRNFAKGKFRFISTSAGSLPSDEDLFRTISAGVLPVRMPAFAFLSESDRWALVEKVKSLTIVRDEEEEKDVNLFELNPPGASIAIPQPISAGADVLARGKRVFETKAECSKCHGDTGRGDGPSAFELKADEGHPIMPANIRRGPSYFKRIADASDLISVLTTGLPGTPMPSYKSSLTDQELLDLAAYTESLWQIESRPKVERDPQGVDPPSPRATQVALGELTYLATCAGCHGKLGRGDGAASADLNPKPANLTAGVFKFKSTPEGSFPSHEDLRRTLRQGVPGSSMPAWDLHAESELSAVIAYLMETADGSARDGRPVGTPPAPMAQLQSAEARERGKALYATNCAVCHGDDGRGDGPFAAMLADYRGEKLPPRNFREQPFKAGADPETVFRTISYGFEGTMMPGFANALGEEQRWDLVAFVLSLPESAQRIARGGMK